MRFHSNSKWATLSGQGPPLLIEPGGLGEMRGVGLREVCQKRSHHITEVNRIAWQSVSLGPQKLTLLFHFMTRTCAQNLSENSRHVVGRTPLCHGGRLVNRPINATPLRDERGRELKWVTFYRWVSETMAAKKGSSKIETLTALPGVGAATAKKLIAAKLDSVSKIAGAGAKKLQ